MPEEKQQQTGMSNEQLIEVIKAIREPDEETKEKIAGEKARRQARRENWIKEREAEEELKRRKYEWCVDGSRHHKMHPYENQHTIRGQENGDGYVHAICIKCQAEFPPFKHDRMPPNVELSELLNLTPEIIEGWAKDSRVDLGRWAVEAGLGSDGWKFAHRKAV